MSHNMERWERLPVTQETYLYRRVQELEERIERAHSRVLLLRDAALLSDDEDLCHLADEVLNVLSSG